MKIGKIVSISYGQLKVKVLTEIKCGSINFKGEIYYFGNIGSFFKVMNTLGETIICEVISIFDSDLRGEKFAFDLEGEREILIKPIGSIDRDFKFNLGVGVFPSLYSDVSILTDDDMRFILDIHEIKCNYSEEKIHKEFQLGKSKNLINYPVDISIDSFFNMHSAVLGNSGSGKSNTIAHILQQILEKVGPSAVGARVLIFDVNGEYREAFERLKNKNISVKFFKLNSNKEGEQFFLPHFLMTLNEWCSFLLATEATQRPFWNKVLQESYRFYELFSDNDDEKKRTIHYLRHRICSIVNSVLLQVDSDTSKITAVTGLLQSIKNLISRNESLTRGLDDLVKDIEKIKKNCKLEYGKNNEKLQEIVDAINKEVDKDILNVLLNSKMKYGEYFDYNYLQIASELVLLEEDACGNRQVRGYVSTMLMRLTYFLENSDCDFMRHSTQIKTIENFFTMLWGGADETNQLVIIDTSELSPDILEMLTSVMARLIFDDRKKLNGDERRKKPIHLVLDEAHRYIKKDYKYLLIENIFEKVAREGRKYSFYLLVSSQRPSELLETVLSQCANFIIHRIQNGRDMQYIQDILPYFSDDFINKIKQAAPGEALVFGNCVPMPLCIKVDKASPMPSSKNCNVAEEWFIGG